LGQTYTEVRKECEKIIMIKRIQTVQSRHAYAAAKRRIRRNRSLVLVLLVCAAISYLDRTVNESSLYLPDSDAVIRVYNTETAQLMELNLEEYVAGVVAAEMPASFAPDALKAQAVAARTFAVNRMQHPNSRVTAMHPQAQITSSPETCQAWIDEETQRLRWGSAYTVWHNKIVQAVTETAGEVLYYDGTLIEPVYHASCGGGRTEDAEQVWGVAKPYLTSVECNHPADKHSGETIVFTLQEFADKLQLQGAVPAGVMYGENRYLNLVEKTKSNRVKEVQIGDSIVRGGELRSALGLKSTLMSWNIADDHIIFTTSGYGHGAGMCQHGADYYAGLGYDYRQILQHYYPGTTLGNL